MAHVAFGLVSPIARDNSALRRVVLGCCVNSRRTCTIRAAATPSRRTTGLSTLAATSILAAATGGPSLAAWGAMFGVVGLVTEAPVGLISIAAGICAGLADLIAIDIGRSSFDSGLLPFAIFAMGSTVATIIETTNGPVDKMVMPAEERQAAMNESRSENSLEDRYFTAWDRELEKRDDKGGD